MDFGKLELHYLSCFEPILQQKNLSFLYLFISTSRLVVCKTWFYLLFKKRLVRILFMAIPIR